MAEAPYGSWRSPITADLIVSASIGISQPRFAGSDVYWVESRPMERGRNVIVRRGPDGSHQDVLPPPFNARTRVHEYGGGDYVVDGETIYFSNFADQRLYRTAPGVEPQALTREEGLRYADAVVDGRRRRLVCVREDHRRGGEPINTIVAVDLASGEETVLVQGNDFYASPRLSPDGSRLAWLSWDHPNMPWDGCRLFVAGLDSRGGTADARLVAGGDSESVFQPEWSPDGSLWFVSDPSGWWNLYRWDGSKVEPMAPMEAEFGLPLWQFGMSTYDFAGSDRVVCAYCVQGSWRLAQIDAASGRLQDLQTPFTAIASVRAANGRVLFLGGAPDRPMALYSFEAVSGEMDLLKAASDVRLDPGYVSIPETIEFPTEGGTTAFGFYYPPLNKDFRGPAGEKPPLLVMSHG
ncbi:MAG TPA: S9 family peptidase, partial [Dehalococcoidia bacterium]|nr:S9 family peptidase [Dehalococcoidia bacterium]